MRAFVIKDEHEEHTGKSYALAKFALIEALLNNKNVSIFAPSLRQSNIVLNYVKQIMDKLQIPHDYNQNVDSRKIYLTSEDNSEVRIETCLLRESRGELSNRIVIFDNHEMMSSDYVSDLELIDIRDINLFNLMPKELV